MANRKKKKFKISVLRRILHYIRPYRKKFYLALFMTIAAVSLNPVRPYIFQRIIDNELPQSNVEKIRELIALTIIILLVQSVLTFAKTYLTEWLGQSIIKDIRDQVFRHINRLKLAFIDKTPIGKLQTRTISDIETLNDMFSNGILNIISDLLQVFAVLGLMLYTDWQLTLVVLLSLPLMLVATYIFKETVKKAFGQVRTYVSNLNSFMQEHISGMLIIQAFNREDEELKRFKVLNEQHKKAHLKTVMAYSIFFPVVELISALATALLVWYGSSQVIDYEIKFGVLVAFIMYLQMFFRPIRFIADKFNTLQLGLVSAERVFDILDVKEFIRETDSPQKIDVKNGVEIQVKDLSFAYKDENYVLKNVNFTVEKNQKVAIVGTTGSGKTTIINLINRFYEYEHGQILFNNVDIRKLSLEALRKNIGLVLQDVFLFSGTIFENISLMDEKISLEEVQEAAKSIGAHEFIMNLPNAYNFEVRERGSSLSLGQRQLIAFTRILVHKAKLLILDEATSSVDTETEHLIQQALEKIMENRSSIVIAHRLSTIRKADKIIVLSKGKIIEQGTHEELLEQKNYYSKLYQVQFQG